MQVLFRHLKVISDRKIAITLFICALFIRFPFFFRDYIDRDESTFILIGQSLVDGYLPFVELWDIKPPLVFLFYAGIISVFGKSFFAIRLAGTLLVTITAFFTFKIGTTFSSKKTAFWTAITCVILQSLFGSIQGVMSEHICMALLTPAVFLTIYSKNWYWLGLSGLLMGISVMIKLNLAYVVLFIGLYLIYYFVRTKKIKRGVAAVASYGLGIILIILLTLLPYYLQDLQNLWWKSVIIAPLDYASARRYSLLKLLPTFLLVIGLLVFGGKKKFLNFQDSSIQILLVTTFGVLYAFFKGGRINSHYLIQLYPFIVVFAGIIFSNLFNIWKFKVPKAFVFLLLIIPAESYLEYYRIAKHKIERGSFYNGEGITVPQYLLENKIDTENILFFEYHIGYWVLNKKPPTKAATHPSNICKPEMFAAYDNPRKTSMEELRFIMEDVKPTVLVTRKDRLIFDKEQIAPNTYIDAFIKEHYKLLTIVDDAEIYERLE